MKKQKEIEYENVMNAIAIINANIIPTRSHEMKQHVKTILQVIEKVFKPHGARGPHKF